MISSFPATPSSLTKEPIDDAAQPRYGKASVKINIEEPYNITVSGEAEDGRTIFRYEGYVTNYKGRSAAEY